MKVEELMAAENDAAWAGYQTARSSDDPKLKEGIAFATKVLFNTDGKRSIDAKARLFHALGTSDFPYLVGNVLDRTLLAEYQETSPNFERIFQRTTRRDFRNGQAIRLDGGDGKLQEVSESGGYTDATMSETAYQYKLKKWGKSIPLAWELLLNDDLGAFRSIPSRFGRGSRRTREWYLTNLFFNSAGALDSYFAAGLGGQASVSNLPLNAANLGTAISAMLQYTDKNGELIAVRPKFLCVAPALYQTALELVSEQGLAVIASGLSATNAKEISRVSQSNLFIKQFGLEVVNLEYLPNIVTTGTLASTSWALFSDPADLAAGEVADLEGEVGPQIFMKVSDQQRVGGSVDPMGGSFQNDSIAYKVRMCFNGIAMSTQAGWASDGQ